MTERIDSEWGWGGFGINDATDRTDTKKLSIQLELSRFSESSSSKNALPEVTGQTSIQTK